MRTPIVLVSLCLVLLGTAAAEAHAVLDRASPLVGSTVAAAPRDVSLWFSQSLDPASGVEVSDAAGGRVDQGKAQISGNAMRVALKSLSPGTYRVHWHVLGADTHKSEGSFVFHVGKP
jgi:copper resistance protein C